MSKEEQRKLKRVTDERRRELGRKLFGFGTAEDARRLIRKSYQVRVSVS